MLYTKLLALQKEFGQSRFPCDIVEFLDEACQKTASIEAASDVPSHMSRFSFCVTIPGGTDGLSEANKTTEITAVTEFVGIQSFSFNVATLVIVFILFSLSMGPIDQRA